LKPTKKLFFNYFLALHTMNSLFHSWEKVIVLRPITSKIAAEFLDQSLSINSSVQIGFELVLTCCVMGCVVGSILGCVMGTSGLADMLDEAGYGPRRAPTRVENLPRYPFRDNSPPPPYSVV
jgi:ubiquitin C-terminal hydrolase